MQNQAFDNKLDEEKEDKATQTRLKMKAGSKKLNMSRATNAKSARGATGKKSQKAGVDA